MDNWLLLKTGGTNRQQCENAIIKNQVLKQEANIGKGTVRAAAGPVHSKGHPTAQN